MQTHKGNNEGNIFQGIEYYLANWLLPHPEINSLKFLE